MQKDNGKLDLGCAEFRCPRKLSGTLLQSKHRWERGRVSRMRGMVDTVKSWSEVSGREKAGRIVFCTSQACSEMSLHHTFTFHFRFLKPKT